MSLRSLLAATISFPPFVPCPFTGRFTSFQARSENLPDKTADGPLANPLEEGAERGGGQRREGGWKEREGVVRLIGETPGDALFSLIPIPVD